MKKLVTDCEGQFFTWFPEIDNRLFKNFRVKSIVIKVEDFDRKPVEFKYTTKLPINPLADYKS
jgi:hypothetical protein